MGCSSSKSTSTARRPLASRSIPSPKPRHDRQFIENEDVEIDQEKERELLASKMLTEEKKHLHDRAMPMMLRRLSVDLLHDTRDHQHETSESIQSIKIQKKLRRKYAKLAAEKSQKWMLFNNADIFDEHEMILLAAFMETVLKRVPELHEYEIPSISHHEDSNLKAMSKTLLDKWGNEEDPNLREDAKNSAG
jgi:hypothetical protein